MTYRYRKLWHTGTENYDIQVQKIMTYKYRKLWHTGTENYGIHVQKIMTYRYRKLWHTGTENYDVQVQKIMTYRYRKLWHTGTENYDIQVQKIMTYRYRKLWHTGTENYDIQVQKIMTYRYRKWNDSEETADCYSNSHTHFLYWCSFTCPFPILRSLGPHTIITNLHIFLSPIPSSSFLVDGCIPPAVEVFSHTRKAKNPYALLKKKSRGLANRRDIRCSGPNFAVHRNRAI